MGYKNIVFGKDTLFSLREERLYRIEPCEAILNLGYKVRVWTIQYRQSGQC